MSATNQPPEYDNPLDSIGYAWVDGVNLRYKNQRANCNHKCGVCGEPIRCGERYFAMNISRQLYRNMAKHGDLPDDLVTKVCYECAKVEKYIDGNFVCRLTWGDES